MRMEKVKNVFGRYPFEFLESDLLQFLNPGFFVVVFSKNA